MPLPIDLQQLLPIVPPLVEAVGLHVLAREIFRDAEGVEPRKRECIDDLKADHAGAVFGYLDNELQFELVRPNDLSKEEDARIDRSRKNEAERIADTLWEDALQARNLEYSWMGWCRWERLGRIACDIGRLLGGIATLAVLLMVISGSGSILGRGSLRLIAAIVIGGPIVLALVSVLPKAIMQNRTMRFLEAPRRGTIRGRRRFGDA